MITSSLVRYPLALLYILILLGAFGSTAQADDGQEALLHPQRASLRELGRRLFFDARFSQDGTVSCAACHQPERAFSDGKRVAQGVHGRQGTRNTPSLRHTVSTQAMFWDGRRPSLETQVLDPFINPHEHGLHDHAELLRRLRESPEYDALLHETPSLLSTEAQLTVVAAALSAYVRSLAPTATRLDRYLFHGETSALQPNERRGLELFRGQAQCTTCHHIDSAGELPKPAYLRGAFGHSDVSRSRCWYWRKTWSSVPLYLAQRSANM